MGQANRVEIPHVMQLRSRKRGGKDNTFLELEEMRREILRPLGFSRYPVETKVRCGDVYTRVHTSTPEYTRVDTCTHS